MSTEFELSTVPWALLSVFLSRRRGLRATIPSR